MKIAFVTDTGTGSSVEALSQLGIYCIPLQITHSGKTLLESEEISVDEVYSLLEEGYDLKTSLASMAYCDKVFKQLKAEGYEQIFAVPICTGLSGTINMMRLCAEENELGFDYFDSHVTAVVQEYMITRAKELVEEGKSLEEVKEVLQAICDTTNTLLIVDDLQHLAKGGRLTPLAATLLGLLKIKPILQINQTSQGKIDVFNKVRTMHKAKQLVVDHFFNSVEDACSYHVTIAHVLNEEEANSVADLFKAQCPNINIQVIPLVSVVGVHTGLGCLAIQYFKQL